MRALLILALLFGLGTARAELVSARMLHDALVSGDPGRESLAIGYIAGAFDATQGVVHCAPNPDIRQLVAAVAGALRAADATDKATLDISADQFFVPFLMRAYPCQRVREINRT